jgi:hypothetical protein
MSRKHYPQIDEIGKFKDTGTACFLCNASPNVLPTASVRIQVSWFRGEDEFEHICNPCSQPRQTLASRIQQKWDADNQARKVRVTP